MSARISFQFSACQRQPLRWIKFTDVHRLPVFVEAIVVGVEWFDWRPSGRFVGVSALGAVVLTKNYVSGALNPVVPGKRVAFVIGCAWLPSNAE
jgi:hypothetical protein